MVAMSQDPKFGAFLVAPHLSNFDLILIANAFRGLHGQVLVYGQPTGGYDIQNQIRASTKLEITPVSEDTHQRAIENMKSGGFVITAVDRPIRSKAHRLEFFERPSPLPAGHIRMALEADVPVLVAAAFMRDDGYYDLELSEPIPMEPHPDPAVEIKHNGETVLRVIEGFIRKRPGQWLMYYPVWPEVLEEMN
jgi:KDO2-lipid IV(A) lauroyltransferase